MGTSNQDQIQEIMEGALQYFFEEDRLNSFKKFPTIKGAPLCHPKGFASAGFYNVSTKKSPDTVKCFACDKELGNWEPGDDPWAEHVQRGQECPFVKYRQMDNGLLSFNELLRLIFKHKIRLQAQADIANVEYEFSKVVKAIKLK